MKVLFKRGLLFLFFLLPFLANSQAVIVETDTSGKKEVKIIDSDLLENETDSLGNRITKLSGGVELQQDSVFMFCDTAFKVGNDIIAYGNVAIQQNDSLKVFSDSLVYRGETKIADLFGNVVMENAGKNLYTNYLNYELDTKIARYTTGALITQGDTKLVSKRGTYFVKSDEMYFKDSITVVDSTFILRADTLLFNTESQVVTFLGPTLINQDSNLIYCESGFYDMETKLAEFTQNAQYVKGKQKATAQMIVYDGSMKEIRLEGNAKFEEGNKLATADVIRYEEDNENTFLEGNAYFRDSIQEVRSDETIKYNSKNESFSTSGRSKVVDKEQILQADKLDFDDKTGLGLAEGAVFWQDTIENISINTEVANYNKETDYLKATGGRPLLTLANKDTLFLASDTLISSRASEIDTTRIMQSFEDVRIFKSDLQALADSMAFISKDSLFKLFKNPVLWSDTSQFKGDSIYIQMKNGSIDRIFLYQNAFIVTSSDLRFFNQIKGKIIIAYFVNSQLDRVKVQGNAESLYYVTEEEGAYLGLSKTICSEMLIYFKNNNVDQIKFFKQPNSDLTPMKDVINNPPQLDGFSWDYALRPKSLADLRDPDFSTERNQGGNSTPISTPESIDGFSKPNQSDRPQPPADIPGKKRPNSGQRGRN